MTPNAARVIAKKNMVNIPELPFRKFTGQLDMFGSNDPAVNREVIFTATMKQKPQRIVKTSVTQLDWDLVYHFVISSIYCVPDLIYLA